jgi:hypothetical protein
MVGGDALHIGETHARDVQLLLWAVGEARDRVRRRDQDASPKREDMTPADGSDFFTEWQPAAS